MKIKISDAIGITLVVIGILMTVMPFFVAARGPSVAVRDLQLREIPNAPPPPVEGRDRIKFVLSTQGPEVVVPTPWRMRDWVQCVDGTQVYNRNVVRPPDPPMEIPCTRNGGVRAYGPGLRLNEK